MQGGRRKADVALAVGAGAERAPPEGYHEPRGRCRLIARPDSSLAPLEMADTTPRIAELKDHVGRTVTVRGWVTHVRSSGKVAFAVIRDGTGVMQAAFVKPE